jgi:hypothetical protein
VRSHSRGPRTWASLPIGLAARTAFGPEKASAQGSPCAQPLGQFRFLPAIWPTDERGELLTLAQYQAYAAVLSDERPARFSHVISPK